MKNLKDNEINAISGGWVGVAKSILDWGGRALTVKESVSIGSDLVKDMKENPERWEHPEYEKPWDPFDKSDSSNDRDNSSRVICTHFYQKGMLSRELWRADMEYTLKHLPQSMVNGYHLWAIPYVRLMRKSPLAEKLMYPIAYHRARETAYQMGYISKGSIRGKIFRTILEPICLFLGIFTKEHKYQELWRKA
ncbi:MAG: hypothetical protein Q4A09_08080 [Capnocytophaga felis]|nr:hypothetical protein [Capnocytophaga felis]